MKLLIYSHSFAPQVGGIETFSMYLAQGLIGPVSEEKSVIVVTNTAAIAEADSAESSVEVTRRPGSWALWRLIGGADKVLIAGPAILPLLFALIRRKTVIVTHHGYQSICPNGMLFHFPTQQTCPGHFAARRYLQCLNCNTREEGVIGSARLLGLTFVRRLLSRCADWNVAVSEHVRRRIALPKTHVICNGVPDLLALPEAPFGFTDQLRYFAYTGRLVTEKGVSVLVEAASILKERGRAFRVLIIGDGPERTALRARVTALNLDQQVVFLGFLSGAELEEATAKMSALVMPSICEDAAPFSVLEQMMRGRLVIGSNLGGLAEEIGDCGLTFAAGDAHALADQMEQVIEQPELIARLGKMARARAVKSYTLQRMLDDYRALVDSR
jgi:glycosyltransferase involved in cell wall biosynthesis